MELYNFKCTGQYDSSLTLSMSNNLAWWIACTAMVVNYICGTNAIVSKLVKNSSLNRADPVI